ncbi:MAG: pantoate-beta-alanine ligase, pantoate-beta-alanine ligase [Candidatus Peregrinibacteria bacterium GW2011_GWF2_39_17]|nr:MAG: pantoate-beta-alanine ligase, pantoate-beta-alanine ligase [Candidatus Peregrinibacteria bacterium GW2011_GWF2_39_17]
MNSIGFVPTMGYLHEGHLSLVRAARQYCDRVVVSIFVNPTQFEPGEDFKRYPRDEERDRKMLEGLGVDEIWCPTVFDIYPEGFVNAERIEPPDALTSVLCGRDRPHHFSGVATVVKRLFEHVQPTDVYFGQKDFQQTRVVDWLIDRYFKGIRLHVLPTVREADGLAMSSRNVHLSGEERKHAVLLYQTLSEVKKRFESGERRVSVLLEAFEVLQNDPLMEVIYAEILEANYLKSISIVDRSAVVFGAVRMGKTRLIDNVELFL